MGLSLPNAEQLPEPVRTTLEQLVAQLRANFATRVTATKEWDPTNVLAGANTSTTVTVPGAVLGQPAVAGFSLSLQGMHLTAYVSAVETVTVILNNVTAGAVNLASGTLRVDVLTH